jgi:predicted DNA-binding transcriptional regulator AlpA
MTCYISESMESREGKERNHKLERQFLSALELEALTGIARKTWLAGGAGTSAIPKVRFGRSVKWPREAVEKWLRERLDEAETASGSIETLSSSNSK